MVDISILLLSSEFRLVVINNGDGTRIDQHAPVFSSNAFNTLVVNYSLSSELFLIEECGLLVGREVNTMDSVNIE